MRSRIVRRSSLNRLAIEIGLDRYVIAQGGNGFAQKHLYGDTLEAMMGAVYLDKGYDFSNRLFINGILRKYVDLDDMSEQETDFKSRMEPEKPETLAVRFGAQRVVYGQIASFSDDRSGRRPTVRRRGGRQ